MIKAYYGINREKRSTLHELSHAMNVTPERVRQIRNDALRRLRKKSNRNILIECAAGEG